MNWLVVMLFLMVFSKPVLSPGQSVVESLIWKKRVVLLFGTSASPVLSQQFRELCADMDGISDRDIAIFRVTSDNVFKDRDEKRLNEVSAQQLRQRYSVDKESFCLILIGKDGAEKLRKEGFTDRDELYKVIDAMPMRRREMNRD